jgi:hypothetical protein
MPEPLIPLPLTTREIAKLLRAVCEHKRLIVAHEGGFKHTIVEVVVDPAGNLVIWLED